MKLHELDKVLESNDYILKMNKLIDVYDFLKKHYNVDFGEKFSWELAYEKSEQLDLDIKNKQFTLPKNIEFNFIRDLEVLSIANYLSPIEIMIGYKKNT